jgi:transposase
VEVGHRALHAHLEQAAAASVNATNALKEQVTADVRETIEALGKRLEDRMDRRDRAVDEKHATHIQVLGQVLKALKDLDRRVGRSGSEDRRSVMMRLAAIEFSAGDAWEGRKDPLAGDDDDELSGVLSLMSFFLSLFSDHDALGF